jgi:hypothetical protein
VVHGALLRALRLHDGVLRALLRLDRRLAHCRDLTSQQQVEGQQGQQASCSRVAAQVLLLAQ